MHLHGICIRGVGVKRLRVLDSGMICYVMSCPCHVIHCQAKIFYVSSRRSKTEDKKGLKCRELSLVYAGPERD